jgi:hypothetical protein
MTVEASARNCFSSWTVLQSPHGVCRPYDVKSEADSGRRKVTLIERHQHVGLSIRRRFQHEVVTRVGQDWPPQIRDPNRLDDERYGVEQYSYSSELATGKRSSRRNREPGTEAEHEPGTENAEV